MKLLEWIEYLFFLYSSLAATSKQIDTSLPFLKPDFFIAETIKSEWFKYVVGGGDYPIKQEVDEETALETFNTNIIYLWKVK